MNLYFIQFSYEIHALFFQMYYDKIYSILNINEYYQY